MSRPSKPTHPPVLPSQRPSPFAGRPRFVPLVVALAVAGLALLTACEPAEPSPPKEGRPGRHDSNGWAQAAA